MFAKTAIVICLTRNPSATGLVSKNAEDIGEIADAGEEEEEDADALGAFPAVVEEQLRHARAEIKDRAEVAKYLTPDVNVKRICFGRFGWAGM